MKRSSCLFLLVQIVLAISFSGCENDSDNSAYDIFVYGVQNQKGTIWRNGSEQPEPLNSTYLFGSFVDGKDFYVAGIGEGGVPAKPVAKYWKNGTEVALSDGTHEEWAYDIAVIGSDVYAVGYDNVIGATSLRAKYWKNGNEVILGVNNTDVNTSIATDVFVSGSDFYILGVENVNNNDSVVARVWKNGEQMRLEHDSVYYGIDAMAVNGNDTYMTGYEGNKEGFRRAVFWKNGVKVASHFFQGNENFVFKGNDAYSTGDTGFWKNDVFTELTDQRTEIVSIDIYGNDIFVAGNLLNNANERSGIVWKNSIPVAPFLGTDPSIRITGAAVVKR